MINLYHLPAQLFMGIIILLILYRTYSSVKANKLSRSFLIFWMGFWIFALILLFNLPSLSKLASSLGIGRGVDLVIYLSLIMIFSTLFKLIVKQKNQDKIITKIIRKIAIDETMIKSSTKK